MRTKRQNKPKRYAATKKGGKGKRYRKAKRLSKKAKSINTRQRRRTVTRRKMRGGENETTYQNLKNQAESARRNSEDPERRGKCTNKTIIVAHGIGDNDASEKETIECDNDESLLKTAEQLEKMFNDYRETSDGQKAEREYEEGKEERDTENDYRKRQEEVNKAYYKYDCAWISIYSAGNERPYSFTEDKLDNLNKLKERYIELQRELNVYLQTDIGKRTQSYYYNNIYKHNGRIRREEEKEEDKIYIVESRDNSVKAALERKERDDKIKSGETDEEKYERLIKDVLARNFLLEHVQYYENATGRSVVHPSLNANYEKDYGIYKDKTERNGLCEDFARIEWSWGTQKEMTQALTTAVDELIKFINTRKGKQLYDTKMKNPVKSAEEAKNDNIIKNLVNKQLERKENQIEHEGWFERIRRRRKNE